TRRPPRDPRLRVRWNAGAKLDVTVDALDTAGSTNRSGGGAYLNRLDLSLHLTDATRPGVAASVTRIPQIAPGRYQLSLDAPRSPALATIRLAGSAAAVDRLAVAGRYAPEFNAVGNDR